MRRCAMRGSADENLACARRLHFFKSIGHENCYPQSRECFRHDIPRFFC